MAKRMGKKIKTKTAQLPRSARRDRPARRRVAAAGAAALRGRIKQVEAERDALRRAVAAKDEQLSVLSERVDRLSSREADLRALLLAAHERLTGEEGPTRQ